MPLKKNITSLQLSHPSIQKVLKIAEEIIEENKILTMDIIYQRAKRILKLKRKGLMEIIQFLFNKKILINGSKHTKYTVLLNNYRKRIYDTVMNNYGATFTFIKDKVFKTESGSPGQFLWHLKMLLKFKLIKKLKLSKYTIFLPINMDNDIGIFYFFINDISYQEIIEFLVQNENIKKGDVHKKIGKNKDYVNYRLKILLENNILSYLNESDKKIHIASKYKKLLQGELVYSHKKF